jgi:hypothetical protein
MKGLRRKNVFITNVAFATIIREGTHFFRPIIPTFHHSNTPRDFLPAKPLNSDLALRTRFSMLNKGRHECGCWTASVG